MKINNDYKIGRSYNVENRIKQIQTSNPYKIQLISTFDCKDCKTLEKRLHNYYKNKQINGEWFNLSNEDILQIGELIQKLIIEINKKLDENTCNKCQFSTYKNENFQKHLKSYNHKINSDQDIENIKSYNKTDYKCDKCNKIFNLKGDYKRHINRKKPCNINICNLTVRPKKLKGDVILDGKKILVCLYCNKKFTRIDNLNVHLKFRCKEKQLKINNEKEEIFRKLLEQMNEQNKKLEIIIKDFLMINRMIK